MSDYWKKKLDELEQSTKKPSESKSANTNYWQAKLDELNKKEKEKKKREEDKQDIAPVQTTQQNTLLQKGALDNGVNVPSVSKSILGTLADAAVDFGAGILGMGEKAVDSAAQLGAWSYGGLTQQQGVYPVPVYRFNLKEREKAMDDAAEFIAKDLYDEEKIAKKIVGNVTSAAYLSNINMGGGYATVKDLERAQGMRVASADYLDNQMEADSVLGAKADSLVQSAGQLVATSALQATGIPWFLTTGVTAYGSELENAYREGATFEEAGTSASISAGAEILTEKIGGIKFGGKSLSDALIQPFVRRVSNKAVRMLANAGIDALGEGGEEILSGLLSAVGQKMTYMDDKELNELFTSEDAFDSFMGGLILGGSSNVIGAVKSEAQGKDAVTGLTKNEQKVVDKVYKDEIAKEEQGGKKLGVLEKNKLYDKVIDDMEKGRISTDTIEEVLGGDTYKTYKDTIDSEEKLQQEYKELGGLKEPTLAQSTRYKELHEQMQSKKDSTTRDELKTKLSDEVFGLVQNDRLLESYNERGRKSQAFKADLTQYESKYHDTIKRAAESGILNDTRRTHEFVDMIAKISADKGVLFDFTNNEKLKNSGFAVDGKQVNGFVTKDGVTLNIDSAKSLNSVVGHEITHVLEGTELYDALQKAVIEYARGKSDYQSRVKALSEIYKDVEGADISKELTADLIGDYLFSDTDFINSLSTGNRNVFQKIYDEIKYLAKVATAGSKEARELERVKRAFENAYREQKNTARSGVDYALSRDINGNVFVDVTEDIFDATNGESVARTIQRVIAERFDNLIETNGQKFQINKTTNDEFRRSESATELMESSPDAYNDKLKTIANADEILTAAKNWIGEKIKHTRKDDIVEFGRGNVMYRVGENGYVADVIVGIRKNGAAVLYDLVNIYDTKIAEAPVTMASDNNSQRRQDASAGDNVAQKDADVKQLTEEGSDIKVMDGGSVTKFSLSTWTPETQTKVRNNLIKAGYDDVRVDKWIKDTNSVAAVIAADKDRLDFVAADNQVMLKNNQEYVKTLDASTLCAKRLVYQGTFDAIQHRMPNTMLSSDDLIDLLNMMKKHKVQTPCGVCYVESRRRHLGKFAQEWLNSYKGEYKPNLDEVTTSDGLEALRHSHPDTYKDFVDAMNKKGSSNPKVVQLRTEYRNEIISLTPAQIKKIEAIGGLRVQSFSDFETPHLLDMMQAVMDMSAKGLTSQAYTKVPNFAWVFGDTGIKINLSLIAEGDGFDADGNLAFSSVEGMDIDEAMKLRDAYSENVGTIIVGANDKHILACMADDRIDFIIPFHRSGWGKNELDMMGMSSYTDYTYGQKEHDLATGKGLENLYPPDYWDYNLSGKENAERYLNLCARTGREPKFSQFLVNNGDGSYSLQPDGSTDGYWKTLIDFKMYNNEGVGAAQQKVQPNFNMDEAYRVLNEYEGGANKLPVANDVVEEFVAKYNSHEIAPTMSLSREGEQFAPTRRNEVYGRDIRLEQDIAPINTSNADSNADNAIERVGTELFPDNYAPTAEEEAYQSSGIASLDDADAPSVAESKPITTPQERRAAKLAAVQTELANNIELRANSLDAYNQKIDRLQAEYDSKKNKNTKVAQNLLRSIERAKRLRDSTDADYAKRISDLQNKERLVREGKPTTRQELHNGIMEDIKRQFNDSDLDLDTVLKKAKNLSTFATVDNTPQRVMEKALGYKEGQVLSDITVNKVAQNETEGIKWLNEKVALIKQISKQYGIKPGSKASAAAQMYAEGFYVAENNDIIEYGDAELAADFPDAEVRANIKALAADPRIRQIYDDTLDMINESRTRNAYPEIKKLDNYFLHFRAMDDTFSRLGLPFNPNDIRAKDLPTDLNGVTADLKPGQPYFASAMHRTGKRTSFDLLGGLERYLTSAKNQIYHIDDIQTLRALRNYIADTYGQANGLEGLDALSEEEAQDRIEQVYNSHLSTFAKFLNEEANVLAGKTSLIDRGLEGMIGRRAMTFLDTLNKQVGSNMVGFNISSSLTNFLPVAQTFAKTNKQDFVKAFAQTAANKVGSIFGRTDSFAENSPVVIRRKGADRFYRTPWQKAADVGYVLMSAVDDVSTELIARTKYNELTRKGMDAQKAHYETDKWVSRLMGDRSLGQMPQLYNSKTLGMITKFQLEVRNQLDSQFYDTIQEAKVSNAEIENGLAKNARTAAKITSTFVQLAVAQHLFGKAFESVAGYNPAFDIISVVIKTLGFDDDEDSEDTVLDNIEQGFMELLEDLPYTSTLTGGRIPISSALPVSELIKGVDEWGNEKPRVETIGEIAPYYLLPGGYGQIKKTVKGLNMFSDEHPIAGSYTASGNLRFPVEDTTANRVQAAIFGQWASENARDYFDNERSPLKEKQIQEFIDVDIPIRDYWEYREGLSGLDKLGEKADYIAGLDLPIAKKNLLINNIADRKEPIDLTGYENYSSLDELDFATKYPESYAVAKVVGGYEAYKGYSDALYDIKADKDANGKSISGSRKEKVIDYINGLDADHYTKIILLKSEYPSDDTYNYEIIDYLNSRDDISRSEMETILKKLGFEVDAKGNISW